MIVDSGPLVPHDPADSRFIGPAPGYRSQSVPERIEPGSFGCLDFGSLFDALKFVGYSCLVAVASAVARNENQSGV